MSHPAPPTWHPRTLILQALQNPLTSFVAANVTFLLLIALDDAASELAVGLQMQDAERQAAGVTSHTVTWLSVPAPLGEHRSEPHRGNLLEPSIVDRVPTELLRLPCHLAPIRKCHSTSFLQHVSIGRARNHDIVLRHKSVSKFHGWFELHEGDRLFVKDCDSRNHIFVDKHLVTQRHEVRPGQTVAFGQVQCRVCTPASLWAALHG